MMPPVVAFVVAAVQVIGSVITAISAFSIAGFAVGRILLQVGLSLLVNALFAPKKASVAQRQASVLQLTIGENPREAIFGTAATGGTLLDAWNDGSDNEFETMVIDLADHECAAVTGYYVGDKQYTLTAQGAQTHADFDDGGPRLWIETRLGVPGQTLAPIIAAQGVTSTEFVATDRIAGITYAVARYKISDKVWKSGRPQFKWIVNGGKCYDPRKDSTVAGGSGSHRWGDPTTYEWSENARVCHYNFMRGVWNYAASPPQLMVGPGRSAEEMPPAQVIADANLCDEAVTLKAGGTEPRYRVSAVVAADEKWIDVEEHFAAAMGGQLVERAGMISVDPGASKGIAFQITDDDLLRGKELAYQAKIGRDKSANTVIARYVSPSHLWQQASSPMRRSQADIDEDGEPREQTIDLVFVTSGPQAQRCAEIIRRKARLQASAVVALGPKFMRGEDGDWIEWTSARRFAGDTRVFELLGAAHDEECNVQFPLRETASSVFTWNPAVDELDDTNPAYLPAGAAAEAQITNFDAVPVEITSSAGVSSGAIRATWTPPNDTTIIGVRLEYRPKGSVTSSTITAPTSAGEYVIAVLPLVDVDYEIRATPEVSPRRDTLTTAWRDVLLSVPFNAPQPPQNFVGYQAGDLIRFTWTAFADTSLQYEIRAGDTFELGRLVARVYGGATSVPWPILSQDDDVLFWIKTLHRSGVYSDQAALWVAAPNVLNPNFIVSEDFQAETFPGVRHQFSDTIVGDLAVLELAQLETGISQMRGDYYAGVELLGTFKARTWIETRASAYVGDVPTWDETENDWDAFGDDDWLPELGDAGGDATLDAFIALNTTLDAALIEGFRFNDTTTGARATTPDVATGIGYAPARSGNGVVVGTALEYSLDLPAAFSQLVDYRLGAKPGADHLVIRLDDGGTQFLQMIWRAADELFVVEGNFGAECAFDLPWTADDTISFSLWQSTEARGAVIASKQYPTPLIGSALLI